MRSVNFPFPNADGHTLSGVLDLPGDGAPEAFALFAHCFTCSKNLSAATRISRALAEQGVAVLRFDFTGLGESEGQFAATNFSSNVADLLSAAGQLARSHAPPRLLVGHSLGGAAVLRAALELPAVRAVATIGAPSSPTHVERLLGSSRAALEADGVAEVTLGGRTFRVQRQFLDDLDRHAMEDVIRSLGRALLVLHSPQDRVVGVENAARIFECARHPKSYLSLERADHLLSAEADARYAGALIAGWARRYLGGEAPVSLPEVEPEPAPAQALAPDGRVAASEGPAEPGTVVTRTGEGYRTEVRARGHRLLADEPVSAGGADSGPSPYEYLVTALGACTGMTLRMYADRKGWPLEAVTVRLRHRKIHAEDCRDCSTQTGRVDEIERDIEVVGPVTEEQRARLLEIADRCPVHRSLHSEVHVVSRLGAPGE